MAGTSGSSGARLRLVTARARTLPALGLLGRGRDVVEHHVDVARDHVHESTWPLLL